MRQFCLVGFAVFLSSFSSNVSAADIEDEDIARRDGAYIVARLAGAFNGNSEYPMEFTSYTTDILTEYKTTSFAGAAAIGYRFEDMFGLEVEAGQTQMEAEAHTLLNVPTANSTVSARFDGVNADGSVTVRYGMINLVSEQDMGTFVRPYLSAGLGLAQVKVDNFSINLPAPIDPLAAGPATLINDTSISYAWQIGVGAVMDVSEKISLEAGYRYFRVEDVDVQTSTSNDAAFNLSQHQALLGVRVNF
ncbi:MAG: outer membrane protein [Notoacmeibacter sp.]